MSTERRHRAETAGAAVAGGAAGQGLYQGAGYGTKHFVDARTRKGGRRVRPEQVKRQDKTLKPNKKKYGMGLPNEHPGRDSVGFHRNYPRELPYARAIRGLGHTHEGRRGMLVGLASTVVGGLTAGSAAASRDDVHKAAGAFAFGLEHPLAKAETRRPPPAISPRPHNTGKASYTVRDKRTTRIGETRLGEFARGARGGFRGGVALGNVKAQQPRAYPNVRAAYRHTVNTHAANSGFRRAFVAGERGGMAGGRTLVGAAQHPNAVVVGALGASTASVMIRDHRSRTKALERKRAARAAAPVTVAKAGTPMSPTELQHRRRVQAGLYTAGSVLGLAALGSKVAGAVVRGNVRPAARGTALADKLERHTSSALAGGAGLGAVGGFNQAAISRAEAGSTKPMAKAADPFEISKGPLRFARNLGQTAAAAKQTAASGTKAADGVAALTGKLIPLVPSRKTAAALGAGGAALGAAGLGGGSYAGTRAGTRAGMAKAADPLVRRYGLRGAPPSDVDRQRRQAIWEARSKHLNRKRNRYQRTGRAAGVAEKAGGAVAGGAAVAVAGSQLRDAYLAEKGPHALDVAHAKAAAASHRLHLNPQGSRVLSAMRYGKPGFRTMAAGAAGAATAAGARQVRRHAQKKARKYSTASGGIASGTAARMRDYSIGKSANGELMISAFGIEHGYGSVAKALPDDEPSAGRYAAGYFLPGVHGAVAGKKGRKLRAAGTEVGSQLGGAMAGTLAGGVVAAKAPGAARALGAAGGLAGSMAGTRYAHRRGNYKPQTT